MKKGLSAIMAAGMVATMALDTPSHAISRRGEVGSPGAKDRRKKRKAQKAARRRQRG